MHDAGDGLEGGGLARPVGADQAYELTETHGETDPPKGLHAPIRSAHPLKRQHARFPGRR